MGFKSIEHQVKRYLQKRAIVTRKKLESDKYLQRSEHEKWAISICRNLIKVKDTFLLGNFRTQERYIRNEELGMYVVVKDNVVEIINHTYYYLVPLSGKSRSIICNVFDGHQDADRQSMDEEIRSNIKHSLECIHDKVKNKLTSENEKI